MSTPHYFIAIPLPNDLKEELAAWQVELKQHLTYKQWPHVEDLHITLKFLGAVEETKLKKLQEKLQSVHSMPPFYTKVHSVGTFGKSDKPRVLWADVVKTVALLELQQRVEACAKEVGFTAENRPYRPHITLAKKWDGPSTDINVIKNNFSDQQFDLVVDTIVIYQIYPSNSPKYKIVNTFSLDGGE
ncbi:RNA 2',3'-cyclic phosphodiesterase [Ornithinibacillus sp. L9]|uniref:RNA 2',3'-cyclic phosphodiesterase n=1 Tax=Ornithinibacillus caprae TaxID=2678566 RepID=A0A6N8FC97_9BACI|nr:RNA 2',3'-cyclic phosphodiesterase [Ornithinibacillus caprae]MUK86791.1 RNA 2',3'-cyclic phosphodiesterase [Ornithinibacillus caprae]